MEHYTLLNTLKFTYPANWSVGLSLLNNGTEKEMLNVPSLYSASLFTVGCFTVGGFML